MTFGLSGEVNNLNYNSQRVQGQLLGSEVSGFHSKGSLEDVNLQNKSMLVDVSKVLGSCTLARHHLDIDPHTHPRSTEHYF